MTVPSTIRGISTLTKLRSVWGSAEIDEDEARGIVTEILADAIPEIRRLQREVATLRRQLGLNPVCTQNQYHMKLIAIFQMYDTETDREWVGDICELNGCTYKEALKIIEAKVPNRQTGSVVVDAVRLFEQAAIAGEPARILATYEPILGYWDWHATDLQGR